MAKAKGTSAFEVGGKTYEICLNHDAIYDIDAFLEKEGYAKSFIQGFIENPSSVHRLTIAFHFGTKPQTKSIKDAREVLKDVSLVDLVGAVTKALENGGVLATKEAGEGEA